MDNKNIHSIKYDSIIFLFSLAGAIKYIIFIILITNNNDIFTILLKFITVLLILLFFYSLSHKNRYKIITLYFLEIFYLIFNLIYFNYFHTYFHIYNGILLLKEGFEGFNTIKILFKPVYLLFFIDLPLLVYLFNMKVTTNLNLNIKKIPIYILLMILLTEVFYYINKCNIYYLLNNSSQNSSFKIENMIVKYYGTIVNNLVDLFRFKLNNKSEYSFSYGKEIRFKKNQLKRNILMIQVESLDSEIIGYKYNDEYVAPFLTELTKESIFYPYTVSYHSAGGTSDAEFSILNSVMPLDNFPSMKLEKYEYRNSIIKRFKKNGYIAYAFHGNRGTYFNRNIAYKKMGFDRFYDREILNLKEYNWGGSDRDLFEKVLESIKNQKSNYIYYVITMSSHGPFQFVNDYYTNDRYNDIKNENLKNYFKSISYVDESLNYLVKKAIEIDSNLVVFIYGDHTSDVYDESYRKSTVEYNNLTLEIVPFYIVNYDKSLNNTNHYLASFMDIGKTVCYIAGIEGVIRSDGVNLVKDNNKSDSLYYKGYVLSRNDVQSTIESERNIFNNNNNGNYLASIIRKFIEQMNFFNYFNNNNTY